MEFGHFRVQNPLKGFLIIMAEGVINVIFINAENTVRLDKTRPLHQRIRCNIL